MAVQEFLNTIYCKYYTTYILYLNTILYIVNISFNDIRYRDTNEILLKTYSTTTNFLIYY